MDFTTIDDSEAYFQTVLYTGNFTDNTAITLPGTNDMQPDLVWLKERDEAEGHRWHDAARGATKYVQSSSANAEATNADTLKSFDSDGFTLGANNEHNQDDMPYAAWCWAAGGGAGSSNTAGATNTTTTSVNTTSKFSISTYTGTGSATTIGHGLGVAPHFILCKERGDAGDGVAYHHSNTAAPETDVLEFNQTTATADNNGMWNDTAPTSTLITLGGSAVLNNGSDTYISYAWTGVQGFSKFGSFTGNGNANGPFVYLGFKPAMLIIKDTGASVSWGLYDNKRNGHNENNRTLYANSTSGEDAGGYVNLLSNGFKIISSSAWQNRSGGTFVYMAWAEMPFVNSKGVPGTAR